MTTEGEIEREKEIEKRKLPILRNLEPKEEVRTVTDVGV